MKLKRSPERIKKLAREYLNPDTSTLAGLGKYLTTWYVLKHRVSYKDPILLEHSLEELLLLYYVHHYNENPPEEAEQQQAEEDSYEEWLKEQMGDDYESEEDMIASLEEYGKQERLIAETLPDKIETDFSMLDIEE